jgi:hypothetical protein
MKLNYMQNHMNNLGVFLIRIIFSLRSYSIPNPFFYRSIFILKKLWQRIKDYQETNKEVKSHLRKP